MHKVAEEMLLQFLNSSENFEGKTQSETLRLCFCAGMMATVAIAHICGQEELEKAMLELGAELLFEQNGHCETAEEWLRRWDANEPVVSASMGGMGPAYEQVIQTAAAEILRLWLTDGRVEDDVKATEKAMDANAAFTALGLTGAMYYAALNLADNLYRGPARALSDPAVRDRLIVVSKNAPIKKEDEK